MNINGNFRNIKDNYLFADVAKKTAEFAAKNPKADIIKLGIGDVTRPLAPCVVNAMKKACDEMADVKTFKGYGSYDGYGFLRQAIAAYYKGRADISADEIFVSDGAKSDIADILDIFSEKNTVVIPDPVYPVYLDTNVMDGREIKYVECNASNDYLPLPDISVKADIIYICSPNNPTGAVYTKDALAKWVKYANENDAIILFDAAYEAFITDKNLPRSIYEIDGAKTCAIEIDSFSKMAGFTGVRCGWTVIPKALTRGGSKLYDMWFRRQSTKFNGVSYIVQCGAAAVFTKDGMKQIKETIDYYHGNAKIITEGLDGLGIKYEGGINSPYIWLDCPNGMTSWGFFDYLLANANVVGTPGSGFGKAGEGKFRLTAFGERDRVIEAVERIKRLKF